MKHKYCSIQDSREWELLVRYKSVWKFVWWVLAFKMLVSTLLVILLSTIALSKNPSGSCGCPTETIHSFNEARIPARITEWVCNQTGATCGGTTTSKVGIGARVREEATNFLSFIVSPTNRIIGCWIHRKNWRRGNGSVSKKPHGWHWLQLQN